MVNVFHENFAKVIAYRNFLAHGTFFYGDPHGNIDKFQVRNTKINKKVFYDNTNIISIESLQKLNDDLLKLRNFIAALTLYMDQETKQPVENLFNEMKSLISNLQIELKIDGKSVQIE